MEIRDLTASIDITNEPGRKFEKKKRNSNNVSLDRSFLNYKKENEIFDFFNTP